MNNTAENIYYEYKIKNGDTFSRIIHSMFGFVPNNSRYAEATNHLLALNPRIASEPVTYSAWACCQQLPDRQNHQRLHKPHTRVR